MLSRTLKTCFLKLRLIQFPSLLHIFVCATAFVPISPSNPLPFFCQQSPPSGGGRALSGRGPACLRKLCQTLCWRLACSAYNHYRGKGTSTTTTHWRLWQASYVQGQQRAPGPIGLRDSGVWVLEVVVVVVAVVVIVAEIVVVAAAIFGIHMN